MAVVGGSVVVLGTMRGVSGNRGSECVVRARNRESGKVLEHRHALADQDPGVAQPHDENGSLCDDDQRWRFGTGGGERRGEGGRVECPEGFVEYDRLRVL
jgi:hypothetical protein